MAQDKTQSGVLDGRHRRVLYAVYHHHRKTRKTRKGSRALFGGELLGSALEKLVGIGGDILLAAWCDPLDESHRADRIQEQHMEAAAHATAVVHHDLFH